MTKREATPGENQKFFRTKIVCVDGEPAIEIPPAILAHLELDEGEHCRSLYYRGR